VREGKILVRSPLYLNESYINNFLFEKRSWIIKKLSEFKKEPSGGILFLGGRKALGFADLESSKGDRITLKALGRSDLEKKAALEKFYKKHTILFVQRYINRYGSAFSFNRIKYRKYRSRWGSCSPRSELNFNTLLSMCPPEVIEYIVVHELCHTRHRNHSGKFYDEIGKYLPDYKKPRKWLRENKGLI
jgi:hypothetical protein